MHADQPDFEHSAFAPLMAAIPELQERIDEQTAMHMSGQPMPGWTIPIGIDPGAPEGDSTAITLMRSSEVGEMRGIRIITSRHTMRDVFDLMATAKETGIDMPPLILPQIKPSHPLADLHVQIRPCYPWIHRSGHVVGRANRVLSICPRPRTGIAQAVGAFLAAPTLTDQA